MQPPSTISTGLNGTIGTAAQVVPTTKYSVGTAFRNKYGDRYMAVTVICDNAYTLYAHGSLTEASFASVADTGSASGALLTTVPGAGATTLEGTVHYVRIAGMKWVLPVVYQAGGDNAAVTIKYQTFN
jgi:hypothetical protein